MFKLLHKLDRNGALLWKLFSMDPVTAAIAYMLEHGEVKYITHYTEELTDDILEFPTSECQ